MLMVNVEKVRDLFGEQHVIIEGWSAPVLLEGVVGVVMTLTEQVMEEHCKAFLDEEVVVMRLPAREGEGTGVTVVAEMGNLGGVEYILVSGVTGEGCLADEQLLMVKRKGSLAEVYGLSIGDFWDEVELDTESETYDYDIAVAHSRVAAILKNLDEQFLTEEMEGEFEPSSLWKIDSSYFEVVFHNLAARLAQVAMSGERDERMTSIDPIELIGKLPFV